MIIQILIGSNMKFTTAPLLAQLVSIKLLGNAIYFCQLLHANSQANDEFFRKREWLNRLLSRTIIGVDCVTNFTLIWMALQLY
jgi:hypothetical protein